MTTPAAEKENPVVLKAAGVSKAFAGVSVVRDVTVEVRAGEVLALMGENGAGKSTVLKILAGVHRADEGSITLDGREVQLGSVQAAQRVGIALIHQEPLSFPDLTVAENIFLGSGAPAGPMGVINRGKIREDARRILDSLGVKLDPGTRMRGLSIADQQMVELAAALSQETRVLLMDEPTAALTPAEVRELFRIVRRLREQGTAIVFISHRLEEVMEISDRVTVLRDGGFVATKRVSETSTGEIIAMMVGRPLGEVYDKGVSAAVEGKGPLLKVEGLASPGRFEGVSLEVRRGEIVGMAGLVGAGRTEVAETIFGLRTRSGGRVLLDGKEVSIGSAKEAIRRGIAYVPEDRQRHGLLMPFTIAHNTTLAAMRRVSALGWLVGRRERAVAEKYRGVLRTRCRDVAQPVRELSGGNQQKVVLSKWLMTEPEVLILDEPTRGIDVGAKAEVHHVMSELARAGKAILMISSDLPEVLAMSDRVVVMREGRVTGEFARGEATQERVMTAATAEMKDEGGRVKDEGGGRATSSSSFIFHPSSLARFRELGVATFLILAIAVAAIQNHRVLEVQNFRNILLYIPLIVVIAMGEMMVIISRNIDLSVGSVMAFAAIVVGFFLKGHPEFSLGLAALMALGIGGALGAVNGILVAFLRVPAIIATLGTLSAYRGLVFVYSEGKQVDPNFIPDRLIRLSQEPHGMPFIVLLAGMLAVATYLFLTYTRIGREIYAIGSNPGAAVLRGIKTRRNLALIFTITGALSGLAGLMYASRFGFINPSKTGDGFELVVISAVVIGGVSVFGGAGSVLGVVLGSILLGTIYILLPVLEVSGFYQLAIYGTAILVAAVIDRTIQHVSSRGAE